MKRYKRIGIIFALILSLAMVLSACGDESGQNVVADGVTTVVDMTTDTTTDSTTDISSETTKSDETTKESEEVSTDETTSETVSEETSEEKTTSQTASEEKETTTKKEECAHSFADWKVTTEATCSKEGTKERACTKCSHKETESIATIAHTEVKDAAVVATCTSDGKTEGKHCSVCSKVLVKQETVKATGHKEETIAGKVPTDTESGLSEGKKCSTCGTVTVAQITIAPYLESCNDDYGYNDLGKQANGAAKQKLYKRMDELAKKFHINSTMNARDNVAFEVKFSDLGLSTEDAIQVWMIFKNDNPLYYWISVTVNIDDTNIYILTDDAYASGTARVNYNTMVYKKIAEYCKIASSETSEYMIALAYHDAIIEAINYAYESDGSTPEDAEWAHNILGVFEKGSGVCEAYARTYQLLLNVRGVENVFVAGTAGNEESGYENHAWNLVKMDDGNWYWCDLTWDDNPEFEWGILYQNFCVNDTQNVNWEDSTNVLETKSFLEFHKPGASLESAPVVKTTLPARSTAKFSSKSVEKVRDQFKADGIEYSVAGYNTVQLLSGTKSGVYKIPETVKYNGRTYTVISIGGIHISSGGYGAGYCFNELSDKVITKLVIPKTVKFIWDFALAGNIEYIEVDSANPYFTSVDGVLFTKSLYTLIQYPWAKPRVDKYVVPEATREIANQSIQGVYYGFGELVLGKELFGLSQANWGLGYHDEKPTGPFGGNYVGNELGSLRENTSWRNLPLKITIAAGNEYFYVKDGLIYQKWINDFTGIEESMAIATVDGEITSVVLDSITVRMDSDVFDGCDKLVSVTINKAMQDMFDYAFTADENLKIRYEGTVAEWNKINKSEYWDHYDVNVITPVECTDGIGY